MLRHSDKLRDGVIEFGSDSEKINRIVQCLRHSPIPEWRSVALPWLATNPSAYDSPRFFQALDSLCVGLQILGKNKTQRLRRLKAAAAKVLKEREWFSDSEQALIKTALANPIGAKKKFLKPSAVAFERRNAGRGHPRLLSEWPHHRARLTPAACRQWALVRQISKPGQAKDLYGTLGNYALLTRPINARANNLDFIEKRKVIFAATNNQAFPITIDLTHYESWTEQELVERQQKSGRLALGMLGLAPTIAWPTAAE